MEKPDFLARLRSRLRGKANRAPERKTPSWPVVVKTLSVRHRPRLLRHFQSLSADDRLLRFGSQVSDELIANYVNGLAFERDVLLGVFDPAFRLVGVGHLAFAPTAGERAKNTTKEQVAEFGVSVSASARGRGVGSALFARAAIHCRNADIDTLYMHCLSSNRTMMHIARKAGMEIQRSYGEADAYLKLPPASPGSMLQEAVDEQLAVFDYTWKSNLRRLVKWLQSLPGAPGGGKGR